MLQNYDPKEREPHWQKYWEKERIHVFEPADKRPVYSLDTPPPTVSGKMHIGHAFSYTQQDIIARYKRQRGFNVFYPWGTDDNGLPTERLVEKLKGVKASKMERQEFIKLCLQTLKEVIPDFVADWKRIGMSCDFNFAYSTINDHSRRISQWSFIDLHKKGRAYRKNAPSLWCPHCETAVAQMECQDAEKDSTFNDIVFKTDGKDLVIATTRPELLPACVAVFAHPQDERYKKLVGKKAKVPLFNQEVKILADERVDPAKGTGIVMCCTFGDQTDIEWYLAYNLELKTAIAKNGTMTEVAQQYKGMSVHEARKSILKDLKNEGLLRAQKPIKHAVKVHERCGNEIEIIQSKQWFIKYLDLREKMLKWGAELNWHPQFMKHRYDNWVKGLQWDWLISNQRYFGVAFPVWYCNNCDEPVLANEKDLPVEPLKDKPPVKQCPKCKSTEFVPEKDVLNTWATSSLTPQLAVQMLPERYWDKMLPMSLRPQAHEIISFWLFNTLVKNKLHFNKLPWMDVMLSGYVTDPHGEKMSKSKGNVVEPQAMIGKYSADALRYWAGGSKLGEDIAYQEKELVAGQKFVVKIWNASKFVLSNAGEIGVEKPKKLELVDRWILLKLQNLIRSATETLDNYEYSKAKTETEQFFWKTFCDNYLEIVKDRLYNTERSTEEKKSAQYTLQTVLCAVLKMLAPIMPHVTEEIYQASFAKTEKKKSIHISEWPEQDKKLADKDAEKTGDVFVEVLGLVRRYKAEQHLPLPTPVNLTLYSKEIDLKKLLEPVMKDLKAVTKAQEVLFEKTDKVKCETFPVFVEVRKV